MIPIVVIYALVTAGFLAFALMSALSWRGKSLGVRLISASVMSALWGATIAIGAHRGNVTFALVYLTEILRDIAWLWFLSGAAQGLLPRRLSLCLRLAGGAALMLSLFWWLLPAFGLTAWSPARLLSISGLTLSFLGLVVLEQLYRNAQLAAQRALRFLIVGLGAMFIYDLFMYAQVELLRGMQASEWMVRGLVNVLVLPCIAIAARRSTEWSVDIFVSRQVVFYTTAFSAVGLYLLLMAAGGYYVRTVGGTWGAAAQLIFLVGAGIALLSMIFSVSLRRRVKVFIAKHFYRNKYDYRIEWLRFINTLSAASEQDVRQVALRAIAEVIGSPGGILFASNENDDMFVVNAYWPRAGAPRANPSHSSFARTDELPRFLAERQWIIDLYEYRSAPDAYQNIRIPDWIVDNPAWRIVSPLLQLDRMVGFVVLEAPPAPFELTYEDRDLLRTLGRHIATHIAQHDANRKLAEARQFEAFNRLTAFMMHDLKNAVAQMSLVVRNAERHKHNPEFVEDAISTIANAAGRIERLIEQLRQGSTAELNQRVLLERVIDRAVTSLAAEQPAPVVSFVDEDMWVDADFERLVAVFGHLLRNAQEATPAHGQITVALERHNTEAWVVVSDSGSGMDEMFIRERLFRPFDSTKGTRGMGIGVYQAREYVRALRGELVVQSTLGEGTRVTVRLPLANSGPGTGTPERISGVN